MCPSLCEGCLVRGTIPRREQAVFTFGRAGIPLLRRNRNDRSGSKHSRTLSERNSTAKIAKKRLDALLTSGEPEMAGVIQSAIESSLKSLQLSSAAS
jgi:hypothetical protein